MTDYVVDFNLDDEDLNADFELDEGEVFNAILQLDVVGSLWGNISGDIHNQTDLQNALDLKADKSEVESVTGALADSIQAVDNKYDSITSGLDDSITAIDNKYDSITGALSNDIDALESITSGLSDSISDEVTARINADSIIGDSITALDSITSSLSDSIQAIDSTIGGYGDIVNYNAADFATSIQGGKADTALQPNDNISELNNNVGYITASSLPTVNDNTITIQKNGTDVESFTLNQSSNETINITVPTDTGDLTNGAGFLANNATGTKALAVGDTSQSTAEGGVAIGYDARANSTYSTAVGEDTRATNTNTTVIGRAAKATQARAIAIGSGAEANAQDAIAIKGINNTANTFQVYTYNMLDMATGLIPDARISTNIARTIDIPTFDANQMAAINSGANTTNIGQIATNTQDISDEITNRQNADNGLQSQIDAIVASSDVFDIVGTYAELQAYDISTVPVNDIIKVLVDSTHNDAATYYRCVETGGVKSWTYIGSEGAYYTKSESDNRFVPLTRTVNGIALSSDITLTAADVGALPDTTVIPTVNNSSIDFQINGTSFDTITLNQSSNDTINITVPTDTNDLTNGAGYITGINGTDVINALGYTPYSNANPDGYITSSALSGYATETWVGNQGYLTGITSGDVTTALGYTPYNSSNPDGFITSAALSNYLQKDVAQSTTGTITFVGQKKIEFKQSAATDKLGFTCFNTSGTELGAFEYRPNTISGAALLNVNTSYSNSCYVGFRYWGTAVNVIAPKPSTAGDYYIPINITDGNTTVTAANTGLVNISSLLPTVPTTDQTFDGTSANPQSGVAIEVELSTNYVKSSAENTSQRITSSIGYINGTPVMQTNYMDYQMMCGCSAGGVSMGAVDINTGNGTAVVTTPTALMIAQNNQQALLTLSSNSNLVINGNEVATLNDIPTDFTGADSITAGTNGLVPAPAAGDDDKILTGGGTWESVNTVIGYTPADNTLSNVSSIDGGSAVKSALDDKVNKSGDTMTGGLFVNSYTGNKGQLQLVRGNYGCIIRNDGNNTYILLTNSGDAYGEFNSLRPFAINNATGVPYFADTPCIDGQWIDSSQDMFSTAPSMNGSTDLTYRIDLPNDGRKYEVMIRARVTTGSTSGNYVFLSIAGNQDGYGRFVCGARTRSNSGVEALGTVIVTASYVASGSKNLTVSRSTSYNGTLNILSVIAYRRIGTNA